MRNLLVRMTVRIQNLISSVAVLTFLAAGMSLVGTGGLDWMGSPLKRQAGRSGPELPLPRHTIAPDGRLVASWGGLPDIHLRDAETGAGIAVCRRGHMAVRCIAWAAQANRFIAGYADGGVAVWTSQPDGWRMTELGSLVPALDCCVLSDDGLWAAAGGLQGTVAAWELGSGRLVWQRDLPTSAVKGLCFTPDSSRLLTGHHDGSVRLWDWATGTELRQFRGERSSITAIDVSPDGRQVATSSLEQGLVRCWQLDRDEPLWSMPVDDSHAMRVAFSRDGRRVACGGIRNLTILNADTGEPTAAFEAHRRPVSHIQFLSDGRTLFSSSFDGSAAFWDLEGRRRIRQFAAAIVPDELL